MHLFCEFCANPARTFYFVNIRGERKTIYTCNDHKKES